MEVKEISASIKFVKNIGNYQSFTAEAGVSVALSPGEKVDEAFQKAWFTVKEEVRAAINGRNKEMEDK